jgi:hypothetical protein
MSKLTSEALVKATLGYTFFEGDSPSIPVHAVYGASEARLIIASGENASGKSFYRRLVQIECREAKTECIHVSVQGRREVAYNPIMAMVYGDESCDSTGSNSASTIQGGIRTSQGRETPHVVVFDEPDLGMSEGASMGAGTALRDWLREPPEHLVAAVVISHSRELLRKFLDLPHHFIGFGSEPHTLESWVNRPVVERSLEDLRVANRARFKAIQDELNEVRAQKGKTS